VTDANVISKYRQRSVGLTVAMCAIMLPATHIIDEIKLFFWRKMFLSTNVVLRALSCAVHNRFVNVGYQYGVTSCTLSKCDIKDAMWQSFSNMILL